MSRRLRVIATTGADVFVTSAESLGPFALVRRYDRRLDRLMGPIWWGSWTKHLGAYLHEPDLDLDEEQRVLARVDQVLAGRAD